MRDALKRLEKLEADAQAKKWTPPRCVRHFIEADNGKPVPFDPNVAEDYRNGGIVRRLEGESLEAFTARALAELRGAIGLYREPPVMTWQ